VKESLKLTAQIQGYHGLRSTAAKRFECIIKPKNVIPVYLENK